MSFASQEIPTPDGDFLEMDWYRQGSGKLAILSHGMEGNSRRPYMLGMAKAFMEQGFDSLLWNFRTCGSRMNNNLVMYHSGASHDLETIVNHALSVGYRKIYLVGFSLGGNITLKYLGERGLDVHPSIKKAVVFSVPCDLFAGAVEIDKWYNKIYSHRFLKSLKQKITLKAGNFTEIEKKLFLLPRIKTVYAFDDAFTAPLHGFKDARDYYHKCSSKYFIKKIRVETLVVNAKNDPFLPEECYPLEEAALNPMVRLEIPETGGHCGFSGNQGIYWSEKRATGFCKEL